MNQLERFIGNYKREAENLVNKMTLKEKVNLMSGRTSMAQMGYDFMIKKHYNRKPYGTGFNKKLNIPPVKFCDGPRGMVSGNATCFPVSMGRGATFDIDLEKEVGSVIGREIRSIGGNFFGGVCVNLPRNPGWGRSQEVYGEDSFHLGQMGAALTQGVQSHNVMACVKHYALNSMENARFKVDVECDERTLREVYLPHFKDCIDAGAASVMTSYNKFRGDYCGHSKYLIRDILNDEWGFSGFVISDFLWGIRDTVLAAVGGMDIEMCNTKFFGKKLIKAVKKGVISESIIDEAVNRIVSTVLAFTNATDNEEYYPEFIAAAKHIAVAKKVAEKSMTLIKNENSVLPISKKTKTIAVIGELADVQNIGDHGSSRVHPPYTITPLQGIKQTLPNCEVIYCDGNDIEAVRNAAKIAESVIIVAGYSHDDEGEYVSEKTDLGGDRKKSLGLKSAEQKLIKEVGKINKNSTVVLIGGNMIMLDDWHKDISSIIMAYYPGMEGGTAIASTLVGDNNPGGKLPFVIPVSEQDIPETDWDAESINYEYYHGYTKLDKENKEPLYHFGHGLSYSTFDIKDVKVTVDNNSVFVNCNVKNIGDCGGDEVVQLYVGYDQSKIDRPHKVLRGFKRVSLKQGEEVKIQISCPIEKLKWYNEKTKQWELEKMTYEAYIGNSSNENCLVKKSFTLG